MNKEKEAEENKMCFAIMPNDRDANVIYKPGVEQAASELEMDCVRETLENVGAGDRIADMVSNISKAQLVVVDLSSGRNEILYDLGVAHGLMKPVIMLVKSDDVVPFLPRTYKFIKYPEKIDDYLPFADTVKKTIVKEGTDLERLRKNSNPVFKSLDPECRPVDASDYKRVCDRLSEEKKESRRLADAERRLEEAKGNEERLKFLEKENAELQGAKKFSETFFERVFGEQVRNKSFDEIMRMFERKIEESDGEVVVENADGQKRKIKFRKLLGDERINLG